MQIVGGFLFPATELIPDVLVLTKGPRAQVNLLRWVPEGFQKGAWAEPAEPSEDVKV